MCVSVTAFLLMALTAAVVVLNLPGEPSRSGARRGSSRVLMTFGRGSAPSCRSRTRVVEELRWRMTSSSDPLTTARSRCGCASCTTRTGATARHRSAALAIESQGFVIEREGRATVADGTPGGAAGRTRSSPLRQKRRCVVCVPADDGPARRRATSARSGAVMWYHRRARQLARWARSCVVELRSPGRRPEAARAIWRRGLLPLSAVATETAGRSLQRRRMASDGGPGLPIAPAQALAALAPEAPGAGRDVPRAACGSKSARGASLRESFRVALYAPARNLLARGRCRDRLPGAASGRLMADGAARALGVGDDALRYSRAVRALA